MTETEAYDLMDKSLCHEEFYLVTVIDMKILTSSRRKAIDIFLHNLALEPGIYKNDKDLDPNYKDGYGNKLKSILHSGEAYYDDHHLEIFPMKLDKEYLYVW